MENIQKEHLKELYKQLKSTPLPFFPENEQLANWIENLIEIDGYIAGLTISVSEGEKILKKDIPNLEDMEIYLKKIKVANRKDEEIYLQCKNYLALLKVIKNALIAI